MFELSLIINSLHLHFDSIVSIGICIGFSDILDFNVSSTAEMGADWHIRVRTCVIVVSFFLA